MHGDCLKLMKDIPDGSVDLILTDPPYGTTQCKWDTIIDLDLMWEQLKRIIKPNGAIVLFGAEPFSSVLRMSNLEMFKYDWIWNKILKTGHLNSKIMPMMQHEVISVFGCDRINYYPIMEEGIPQHSEGNPNTEMTSSLYGKQLRNYDDMTGNTLKYPSTLSISIQKIHPSKVIHPTQKPVDLMEYLIKTYTNKNETVLDFTMGSGTTGIACINTNRNFIGIEMDDNFYALATTRMNDHIPKLDKFL